MEEVRKLVTARRIAEILPIDNADSLEVAVIDGWSVVVRKGEFDVHDLVAYFEIDSWVPSTIAPFLSKGKSPRSYNGVLGERLRTIRLRGQLSQGLILPVPESISVLEGEDLTEYFGVQKWEKEDPTSLGGTACGSFPSFIRKTDQERVQNLPRIVDYLDTHFEVTKKLDGSSMTLYWNAGVLGVCSKNVNLDMEQEGNSFVEMAKKVFKECYLPTTSRLLAIQGELMGPGIQGNRERLPQHQFFVYAIWDIEAQSYLRPENARSFCTTYNLEYVPVICTAISLRQLLLNNFFDCSKVKQDELKKILKESILQFAEGPSLNHPIGEGVVFKSVDGKSSFKAISNAFLLGEK